MFYVGNTFDEKANKGYKTIQNAKKAAEKDGLSVWDEEGVKLYQLKVEVTDDVPDDAALEEKPDGSVNAYDETGEKVGEVSAEEVKEIMDEITAEDVEAAAAAARSEEEVHGTIRRVFEGRLRLRRRPSFEDDAICGVTMFDEKKVEKKAKIGDRVLYKTTDGYWISGDPEHTEFIPEEYIVTAIVSAAFGSVTTIFMLSITAVAKKADEEEDKLFCEYLKGKKME